MPLNSLLFFIATITTEIYTLSLHDALPISHMQNFKEIAEAFLSHDAAIQVSSVRDRNRSEEHTSELQSRFDLVCRLLLEKKKKEKLISYNLEYCAALELTARAVAQASRQDI